MAESKKTFPAQLLFKYLLVCGASFSAASSSQCLGGQFPDAHDAPPAGWTGEEGRVFKLSQDYPAIQPTPEQYPWKAFDYKKQPLEYLKSVLQYCYEGNIDSDVDWQVEKNTKRKWYHAPWMHSGPNGREFIHGLTQ